MEESTQAAERSSVPLTDSSLSLRGLAKQLGLRIIRAEQFFRQRLLYESITASQGGVLNRLLDGKAWRISDLASAEGVRVPSMTELVTRMERQGWLRRAETPHDRRGVEVTITEEGREVIKAVLRRQVDLIAQRLADLPEEERIAIERALPAIDHLLFGVEDRIL